MTFNIFLCLSLFVLIGLILPTILVFALKNHQRTLKTIISVLLVCYLILLFIGTTFEVDLAFPNVSFNLKLNDNWFSLHFIAFNFGKINVLVNLALFLPLGFATFTLSKKHKVLKTVLFSFLLSTTIELSQWILPIYRNTEILDVILNTASGLISAIYCLFIQKLGAFSAKNK
jgi:glycopeptide antibiotics resistance protein